jgi:hypothetical protein
MQGACRGRAGGVQGACRCLQGRAGGRAGGRAAPAAACTTHAHSRPRSLDLASLLHDKPPPAGGAAASACSSGARRTRCSRASRPRPPQQTPRPCSLAPCFSRWGLAPPRIGTRFRLVGAGVPPGPPLSPAAAPLSPRPAPPHRNASSFIDALAIGPYFGSFDAQRDTGLDAFLRTTLPAQVNSTLADVAQHAAIARLFSKPLITYEAGQGLTGDSPLPQQVRAPGEPPPPPWLQRHWQRRAFWGPSAGGRGAASSDALEEGGRRLSAPAAAPAAPAGQPRPPHGRRVRPLPARPGRRQRVPRHALLRHRRLLQVGGPAAAACSLAPSRPVHQPAQPTPGRRSATACLSPQAPAPPPPPPPPPTPTHPPARPPSLPAAPCRYGSWGLMEFMDQDPASAPKLQVCVGAGVCVWGGGWRAEWRAEARVRRGGAFRACAWGGRRALPGHSPPAACCTTTCAANCRQLHRLQALEAFVKLGGGPSCSLLPGAGGNSSSCPGACSGRGQCMASGVCVCYQGYGGADCSNVSYIETYNCGYKCTFDQVGVRVRRARARLQGLWPPLPGLHHTGAGGLGCC